MIVLSANGPEAVVFARDDVRALEQASVPYAEAESAQALVERVVQGDSGAFEVIVDRYGSLMLHTAVLIMGDRDVAEDVVQEAFIQAWKHLPNLRYAGALRSWLLRVVINQCISLKRRFKRRAIFMQQLFTDREIELSALEADEQKGRRERNWDIDRAIAALPVNQRVAVVLHYYHAMTLPEIAGLLNMSQNTLKKRLEAAIKKLRESLRSSQEEPP